MAEDNADLNEQLFGSSDSDDDERKTTTAAGDVDGDANVDVERDDAAPASSPAAGGDAAAAGGGDGDAGPSARASDREADGDAAARGDRDASAATPAATTATTTSAPPAPAPPLRTGPAFEYDAPLRPHPLDPDSDWRLLRLGQFPSAELGAPYVPDELRFPPPGVDDGDGGGDKASALGLTAAEAAAQAIETIRFRRRKGAAGGGVDGGEGEEERLLESNARLVTWSDGTSTLFVGKQAFAVAEHDVSSTSRAATAFAAARHPQVVQVLAPLRKRFALTPATLAASSARKLAAAREARHAAASLFSRGGKVKATATTQDPARAKAELDAAEEARIRAREGGARRRGGVGGGRRRASGPRAGPKYGHYAAADYLEAGDDADGPSEDDEDDDEGERARAALRRRGGGDDAAARLARAKRELAAGSRRDRGDVFGGLDGDEDDFIADDGDAVAVGATASEEREEAEAETASDSSDDEGEGGDRKRKGGDAAPAPPAAKKKRAVIDSDDEE